MANADIVAGARPYGRLYQMNAYTAESVIYKGDFVKKNGAGTIERAAATNAVVGVAMSNAAAGEKCLVADHPEQQFVLQSDDATVDAQTDIGLNYDIVVGTASTTYKRSGMELDGDSGDVTNTRILRLLAVEPAVDNALGANVKCIVKINVHQNATSVAGV